VPRWTALVLRMGWDFISFISYFSLHVHSIISFAWKAAGRAAHLYWYVMEGSEVDMWAVLHVIKTTNSNNFLTFIVSPAMMSMVQDCVV